MNTEKPGKPDGETSRKSEESSSSETNPNVPNFSNSSSAAAASTATQDESESSEESFKEAQGTLTSNAATTSRQTRTVTTQTSPKNQANSNDSSVISGETDEMKRAAAKKLIERYFYQLIDGCGNPNCKNKDCASSGEVERMTPNQAAARAIQLFSQDAKLCDDQPAKLVKTKHLDQLGNNKSDNNSSSPVVLDSQQSDSKHNQPSSSSRANSSEQDASPLSSDTPSSSSSSSSNKLAVPQTSSSHNETSNNVSKQIETISYLDEDRILELIEICKKEKSYSRLIRTIGEVFSSCEYLAQSFQRNPSTTMHEILEKAPKDLKSLKKEDLRTLEGETDKDEDSSSDKEEEVVPHATTVDLPSLRRAMEKLLASDSCVFEALNNGLHSLSTNLSVHIRLAKEKYELEKSIHVFVIIFEIISMSSSDLLEIALPNICKAASYLPTWAQARLAWILSVHCKASLRNLLQTLQQLITLQVITGIFNRDSLVQDNEIITTTTKVLKIVYYANILAGDLESSKLREEDQLDTSLSSIPEEESLFNYISSKQPKPSCLEDQLALELDVNVLDCRKPLLPFEEFYNEPLSDAIEMDNDYLYYKNITADNTREGNKFSFMLYSFVLTPATKTLALYYDSRIRMYSERRMSIFQTQLGQPPNPYLKLKVRREQIIDDALVELEMIAMGNPKDLKKQLVVEFVGEQGIDEGGVSKEFFQLIVEQIFNPDYGMFIHQEDTKTVWFSSTSFENEAQYTLIGIVIGLAIYNNIILAVNFPMVVYRKLMGIKGSFHDLADWNPVLFNSLQSLLDYEEPDLEEVFMLTFKISFTDVFGNVLEHELKPNGENISVTQENKREFVDLYTDFLLNSSIAKQFKAFRKGFQMVTDESPLHLLFRPEEIELLVCGSKKFDFVELEKSTEYEGGYTEKSKIICDFWDIVHGLPIESKRKLLEFTTGSDRVPVGGLSKLKLVIARNGPDSDRLPTSHTCFNVLLLPEYETKEKLEDRLLKAINYSKGFGML